MRIHLGLTALSLLLACAPCLADAWSSFAGPANVKKWSDTTRDYTKPLFYYNTSLGMGSTTAAQLLLNEDGQCEAWANLLKECLRVNNIHGYRVYVYPPSGCYAIGVKNISLTGTTYAPQEFDMATGDLDTTAAGIAGQNKATPGAKLFPGHWIIKVGSPYYDPSYGATYTGESNLRENMAVYGKPFYYPMPPHRQWMLHTGGDGKTLTLVNQDSF